MATPLPISLLRIAYHEAAQAYLRSLPLEHFMAATAQALQRKITLESLDLVTAACPHVQVFNELLVQYRRRHAREIRQVVPDNMVVIHSKKIEAEGSFDVELQPVGPFWMLEYVSKNSKRKDYEENFQKYEQELKVPYSLVFYPEVQELTLYHRRRSRYVSVKPDKDGRLVIPELELGVALLDGWARYWFRGELLPLPAELQRQRDDLARRLETAEAEITRLREQLHRFGGA